MIPNRLIAFVLGFLLMLLICLCLHGQTPTNEVEAAYWQLTNKVVRIYNRPASNFRLVIGPTNAIPSPIAPPACPTSRSAAPRSWPTPTPRALRACPSTRTSPTNTPCNAATGGAMVLRNFVGAYRTDNTNDVMLYGTNVAGYGAAFGFLASSTASAYTNVLTGRTNATPGTPSTVDRWMQVVINGETLYLPLYR